MKNLFSFVLLSTIVLTACTTDEKPIEPKNDPVEVPVFSRAVTETTATILGYTATKSIDFNHDLRQTDAENNVWDWYPSSNYPTKSELENVQDVVCLVPSQNIYNSTFYVSPSQNDRLMWDVMHVDEQHTDDRFYFDNVRHRYAQMQIVVNRYYSVDDLKVRLSQSGYFNCLTGSFESLASTGNRNIYPQSDGNGNYIYTFTIIPQTFKKGTTLLSYKDVYDEYYKTYYYELDKDMTVDSNERLVVECKWEDDWIYGDYVETKTYVSLSVTVADWEVNETIDGSASENN